MEPNFARRGWVISGRLANRFRSRFGTNTKLLLGVIGPISMPNDYLNAVFHDVVSLCGRGRNNAIPHPHGKSFNLVQFYPCVRNVFPRGLPYKKGIYAICRSPCQIETYSLGYFRRALNAISDRNKMETQFAL